jgi:long-subunit fatty acid transport protein
MNKIDFAFRNPTNPVFQQVAGPTLNDTVPQNWHDAIVVKSGIEQDIGTDKTIRAGYSYNNDAVQNSTMTPYIPTILSHYFTGGFGLKKCGWEYDAAYQYSFRPTLHVGTSDLAGSDFASSAFHTAAHWMFLSASRKF